MVDPTPSDYHLTYLRERWDRDHSSRIFLQLAEEYRRRGLHGEALQVLETGLGFHPGYLAAQVALGRCRLEAGEPGAAVKVLERVLTQDPTQAVATRLLAESWLQLGDEDRAQQAIDRCRLIGIPPTELVGLEQRMAAARRAAREHRAETSTPLAPVAMQAVSEAAEEVPTLPTEEAVPTPVEEPVGPPTGITVLLPVREPAPRAPVPSAPIPSAPTPSRPIPSPPIPAAIPSVSPVAAAAIVVPAPPTPPSGGAREVFHLPAAHQRPLRLPLRPGGHRRLAGGQEAEPFGRMIRPRARSGPQAEIFRLLPPPAEAPTTASTLAARSPQPSAPLEPPVAGLSTLRPVPATVPPAGIPSSATIEAPSEEGPAPIPARWWVRPTGPATAEPPSTVAPIEGAGLPAEPEPAGEPTAHLAEAEPARPSQVAASGRRSPLAGTAGVELRPSGSLEVPELRPSDPGTATLGELYLRQGYVQEAEEIFKQVLARDADNEAALAGLEAIGRRRAQKLTAAELLAAPEEQGEKEVRGLTARKIQLLTRYLRTLRRGAGSDVPGTAQ